MKPVDGSAQNFDFRIKVREIINIAEYKLKIKAFWRSFFLAVQDTLFRLSEILVCHFHTALTQSQQSSLSANGLQKYFS